MVNKKGGGVSVFEPFGRDEVWVLDLDFGFDGETGLDSDVHLRSMYQIMDFGSLN